MAFSIKQIWDLSKIVILNISLTLYFCLQSETETSRSAQPEILIWFLNHSIFVCKYSSMTFNFSLLCNNIFLYTYQRVTHFVYLGLFTFILYGIYTTLTLDYGFMCM